MKKNAVIAAAVALLLFAVSMVSVWAGGGNEESSSEGAQTELTEEVYVDYSEEAFNAASQDKRVLFFHASWCPSCRSVDREIKGNLSLIPEGVVVFKTDYDSEKDLKTLYGITYQHTFVLVDADGNALKKWSGGGAEKIIEEVVG